MNRKAEADQLYAKSAELRRYLEEKFPPMSRSTTHGGVVLDEAERAVFRSVLAELDAIRTRILEIELGEQ